jgi:hypothetical protein
MVDYVISRRFFRAVDTRMHGCTRVLHWGAPEVNLWCNAFPAPALPLLQSWGVNATVRELAAHYRACASETRLAVVLERHAALDALSRAVGVHLRRSDKIVNVSNSVIEETEEEWQAQARAGALYVR